MRLRSFAWLALVVGCSPSPAPKAQGPGPSAVDDPPDPLGPARIPEVKRTGPEPGTIEPLAVPGDLPALVVRPDGDGRRMRTVFLPGSCDRPEVYLGALRAAAARRGGLVALQGDKPCPGGDSRLRRWSSDTAALAHRIDAAMRAAGEEDTDDLTVIGYSQGAERAEWLANRYPRKFTRFVLVAGPIVPSPKRLDGARAVVTMAGKGDVRENMALGAKSLRRASIPSTYFEMPSVHHGELDPRADASFDRALEWLEDNARAPRP